MDNLYPKHGLVSRTYSKNSLIIASTFGSKSKFFMTMSIPLQDEPLTNRPVVRFYDLNAKESWALLEDLALYDNESWNGPRDFHKPVKAIALPQDVSSTSYHHLIELENQYYMDDPEQAFVKYASSRTNKVGEGLVSKFMASEDDRLSKFEADFKRQQDMEQEEGNHGNTNPNPYPQPDLLAFITIEQDDGEVMFIEIIRDDDEPQNEGPNEGKGATTEEQVVEYFETFPTRDEITYHRLYLMRRSLKVLRKFHWMILGGRFNQLSHVSSPLLSKPREY
ncbi:hypothetical protein Tco_1233378 [Tanacetum coccineum]